MASIIDAQRRAREAADSLVEALNKANQLPSGTPHPDEWEEFYQRILALIAETEGIDP